MRLIDADKLENDIVENITVKAVSRMLAITQGQPTVKAIPIEWLYQKRTLYLENKCYMSLMVINEILNWLEEENEKSGNSD